MSLIKFFTSKIFFKQVLLGVVATVVLCFILLKWLNISTNHGDFETVPNLKGKSMDVAKIELEQNNLELKIQHTANISQKDGKSIYRLTCSCFAMTNLEI